VREVPDPEEPAGAARRDFQTPVRGGPTGTREGVPLSPDEPPPAVAVSGSPEGEESPVEGRVIPGGEAVVQLSQFDGHHPDLKGTAPGAWDPTSVRILTGCGGRNERGDQGEEDGGAAYV
jgi:hypothetical protein